MWQGFFKRILCAITLLAFIATAVVPPSYAQSVASALKLPSPGAMINVSSAFSPAVLKGLKVDPQNPFKMDFLVDPGEVPQQQSDYLRLVKYFFAALTVPEKDMWVNLSPYEKDRIIPEQFGLTEMGRDLLGQDYILKQLTSSLMFPEKEPGKSFWQKIYQQAYEKFGTTDVPLDTFNKVWIQPDSAEVFEDKGTAFIGQSHLKVMLESDYLAMSDNALPTRGHGARQHEDPQGPVSPSTPPS